jgi:general secretion pathway protein D
MKLNRLLLTVFAALLCSPAQADINLSESQQHWLPTTPLLDVLHAVSRSTRQVFAIDDHVKASVVLGQLKTKSMSYDQLLLVLRNNGLAAFETEGVVNIIPAARIRQVGLPLLLDDDATAHGQEWVMRIVELEHVRATMLVPILRPLVPQQGHMVAHTESNTLLIVSSFDNVRRLSEVIRAMDHQASPPPPRQ